MRNFINTIKYDYLQRTRTYTFLITLCASLAIAYTFVPEPNANYSTIRIANSVGYYNAAWFGYVTAVMSSVFLSLVGFYLVSSGIKKDIDTKVGQIVASTKVGNFKYLLLKTLGNFFVLLTIVVVIFLMSIVLFLLYNDGFPFEPFQFVKPYVFITVPAIFFVSVIAVIFEVIFQKYSVLQNVVFFFLFGFLMMSTAKTEAEFALDVFGNKMVIYQMEEQVKALKNLDENTIGMNIGYVVGNVENTNKFQFNGVNFSTLFIVSRILWIVFGIVLIGVASLFFHRFNLKERASSKKQAVTISNEFQNDILLPLLPKATTNFDILPLLKTELLMLFRKGKRWLWFINVIGMALLVILPLQTAHQIALPVLWFLQVSRLSELTTKETTYNVHYFAFSSFYPLRRLLASQLIAGCILMITLSLPLIFRYIVLGNIVTMSSVIFGAIFIVFLASLLGVLSKGKKLFEVLFFMITYANINGILFVDYFGGFHDNINYCLMLISLCVAIGLLVFLVRKVELKQ